MSTTRCPGLPAILVLLATTAWGGVSGRVLTPEGAPLQGAMVVASAPESADARAARLVAGRRRVTLASQRVDASGAFRFGDAVQVADLEVEAEGYAPGFFAAASGEDVTLSLRRAKARSGLVTAGGKPLADALLVWGSADGSGYLQLRSSRDGTYRVPDPDAWAASLLVLHPQHAPLDVPLDGPKWPETLAHALASGTILEGSVIDEGTGRGAPGVTIWVGGWPLARSGEDGAFRVEHAPEARETVAARSEALAGSARPGTGRLQIRVAPARSVAGAVRDSRTRQPVVGAVVSLRDEHSGLALTAVSDARGRYSFSALPAGRYQAYPARPGYTVAQGRYDAEEYTIDLRHRLSLQHDFSLEKQPMLSGRVQDERGRPVAGALVFLGPGDAPGLYADFTSYATAGQAAWSGSGGEFHLTLQPSEGLEGVSQLALQALKSGYAAGRSEPGPPDALAERPHVITLVSGVELTGRVTRPDGEPLPGVAVNIAEEGAYPGTPLPVHVLLEGFGEPGFVQSDAEGRFALRVHPAIHHVRLRKGGFAPRTVRNHDPRGGTRLDAVLDVAAEVRGQVVRRNGTGVSDVVVLVGTRMGTSQSTATTGADGRFVVNDLAPGAYELAAMKADAGIYETRSVQAPSDVRIELGPAGSLHGRVVDARTRQPVTRFSLQVGPGPGSASGAANRIGLSRDIADAAGSFALSDVPSGEISLHVRAEGYAPKQVDDLTLPADGRIEDLEIALETGAVVRGRVTTKQGEPLSDVTVTLAVVGAQNAETDEGGDYELQGVPAGAVKLEFRKQGFLTAKRSLTVPEATRVDVTLARGLTLSGTVVSGGGAVGNAGITASSSVADAEYRYAASDASGAFTIEGLAPGRYSIHASAEGKGEAKLEDVDVERAGSLRIVLERPPTAVLSGKVVGLPAREDLVTRMVVAEADSGQNASAPVEANGTFRMEKAPAGPVRVRAYVASLSGSMRSSEPVELTLVAGTESETLLELRDDVVISGRVTRNDVPLIGAEVSFEPAGGGGASARARTDSAGRYEVVGVAPGRHDVGVSGQGVEFRTELLVTGSGELDIDATGAGLRGQVLDAASGEPIAGVEVSLWALGGRQSIPSKTLTTSSKGEFVADSLREGRYRLLSAKSGYGQEVRELELARGTGAEVVLELSPADGVRITVVDARDGRPLDAIVVVRDPSKRIVANRHAGVEADGTLTIALANGQYVLSTSATGYGTATLPLSVPGGPLRVALTPGGTLVVASEQPLHGRIRLLQPDGVEYVRCWCNGIADIELKGRRTTIPNVTPGAYLLELVDDQGAVTTGGSIVIREGEVSTVSLGS